MASADMPRIAQRDWMLANPLCWAFVGLGCCCLGWTWMAVLGQEHYPAGRFALITAGLLAAAAAVIIRLHFYRPAFLTDLSPQRRKMVLTALALLLGGLATAATVLLLLAFCWPTRVPWRWGPLLVCWVLVAPMTYIAALQCCRRLRSAEPLSQREEGAIVLLLAAAACFAAVWALYDRTDSLSMDTLRLFLSVLTVAALAAAPLVLVPQAVRRTVVSGLIALLFAGIITATLSASNSPRAIKQLWDRIYRPYLQFFYLTNAYHFYAPDPGPNSYVWFRILFVDDAGRQTGQWLKMPHLDDETGQSHPTSLTYVRYVCLMERAVPQETQSFFDAEDKPRKFYEIRRKRTPLAIKEKGKEAAGPGNELLIPWHPDFTHDQQYRRPGADASVLIVSYARHVLRQAEMPGHKVKGVKIYHVTHDVLTPEVFRYGVIQPEDPNTYRAFYLGEYNADGKLTDPDDPFLYWLLPTIRETPDPDSVYRCYIRKHAGDPLWIRNPQGQWVAGE